MLVSLPSPGVRHETTTDISSGVLIIDVNEYAGFVKIEAGTWVSEEY
jgi:hypothetical protein